MNETPPSRTKSANSVKLVPLEIEHLPHVMSWVNDRDVMQYFANRQTEITEEEERRYLQSLIASRNDRAYSVFDGERYIGQCSINQIYWPARNGRLFVVVRKQEQGKGYGSVAITQLIEKAWNELDLHKIWLIVRCDNRSAQAMYLKLGFDFEGVLRDEYFVGGRFYDMVRMSIVRPNDAR
jgi:diamine N-acetyltransferase